MTDTEPPAPQTRRGLRSPAANEATTVIVDAHQHFWNLAREPMPWMRPEHAAIARTFEPADLAPAARRLRRSTRTILVQAACTDADTDAMFEQAADARLDRRRHGLGRSRSPERAARPARRARDASRSSAASAT